MKTIGLIGGMSWESSLEYYRIINQRVNEELGGFHSASCFLYSVDFAEIEALQSAGRWEEGAELLIAAAKRVEAGGADFLLLCTNTMHKVADRIEAQISIPLLHIADATAHRIRAAGIRNVGLLGTRFTMEERFYRDRLAAKHGLTVGIPEEKDRARVHEVIYGELVKGEVRPESRTEYQKIVERLIDDGAEAVILGCTEVGLLLKDGDCPVPLFDTTRAHAEAAVAYACSATEDVLR